MGDFLFAAALVALTGMNFYTFFRTWLVRHDVQCLRSRLESYRHLHDVSESERRKAMREGHERILDALTAQEEPEDRAVKGAEASAAVPAEDIEKQIAAAVEDERKRILEKVQQQWSLAHLHIDAGTDGPSFQYVRERGIGARKALQAVREHIIKGDESP